MADNYKDIWSLRKPGALDSKRHKQRIRKAIKENLHELIAEENIISSKGNKKVKVPMSFMNIVEWGRRQKFYEKFCR